MAAERGKNIGLVGGLAFHPQLYAPDEALVENANYTIDLLADMSDELRSNGRNLVIILIPTKEQVEDDYWSVVAKQTGIENRSKRFFVTEMILTGLRARGATVLDMTERLRSLHARGEGPFYYRTDGHWNPDGHREAAQALSEFFSE